MNKLKKIVCMAMATFMAMAVFTGCGDSTFQWLWGAKKTMSAVIINGYYEGAKTPSLGITTQDMLNDVLVNSDGHIAVVTEDGNSYLAMEPVPLDGASLIAGKRKQLAALQLSEIATAMQANPARTPEVDAIGALMLATRTLQSSQADEKLLVWVANGFSTCGLLDMAGANILDADPSEIVKQLEEKNGIPDFSGVDVITSGFGDANLPQTTSDEQRQKLYALWSAIFEAGNAKSVTIDVTPAFGEQTEPLPEVSVVPTMTQSIPGTEGEVDPNDVTVFPETSIAFLPDSAQIADTQAAQQALEPFATYMKDNPTARLLVAGSTASVVGHESDCRAFSLERANSIKNLLGQMGCDTDMIVTIGTGFESPAHVPDVAPDGSLIESEAKKNRAVLVTGADSAMAQALLKQFK